MECWYLWSESWRIIVQCKIDRGRNFHGPIIEGLTKFVREGSIHKIFQIEDFFIDYRKTALKPGEIIQAISFQPTLKDETTSLYKVSERKDLDISNVNAGFRMRLKRIKGRLVIEKFTMAFGGVGPTAIRPFNTENFLMGR